MVVAAIVFAQVAVPGAVPPVLAWQRLAAGVEQGEALLEPAPVLGDGKLRLVRIDPRLAALDLGLASEQVGRGPGLYTAGEWCQGGAFLAVINAGMFNVDRSSNVGRLIHRSHVNRAAWKESDQSVLVFDPRDPGLPRVQLLDRDAPGASAIVGHYRSQVQNLRLIKAPGVSVWRPNGRRWSEAAVAQDQAGRILFLFSRTPYEMADFNRRLLALPLGIVRAMHVEGGPEASLSIHAGGVSVDLAGSYETGFREDDSNARQWELPNVLGVRAGH